MNQLHHTNFEVGILVLLVIVFRVLCGLRRFGRSGISHSLNAELKPEQPHQAAAP